MSKRIVTRPRPLTPVSGVPLLIALAARGITAPLLRVIVLRLRVSERDALPGGNLLWGAPFFLVCSRAAGGVQQ